MNADPAKWWVVEVVHDHLGREARRIVLSEHEDEEEEEAAVEALLALREARAQEVAGGDPARLVIEHGGAEIDEEDAIARHEPD
jgi:hypothetical protein